MNSPIVGHSRHRKHRRLLQGVLVTASILATHPSVAQLGPMPPPRIGTTPGTIASGDALAQTAANLATVTATTTANTTAISQVQALAGAAIPNTQINQPNGVLGLDSNGAVSAVRLGGTTPIQRIIAGNVSTFGNYDNGVAESVRANCTGAAINSFGATTCSPGIMGGLEHGAANISAYATLDSVAQYIGNAGPTATLSLTAPTYDATHIYPAAHLTATQIATIQPNMFVQTAAPALPGATLSNPFTIAAYGYTMTVAWPSHGLVAGDSVTFRGTAATGSFPAGGLDTTFMVASVVDANTFTVKLASPSTVAVTNGGGTSVTAAAAGVPWRGMVTGVAADGSSITMMDWSQLGNAASGQVPAAGLTAYVNATTKIWAQNATIHLPAITPGMLTTIGDGMEYDIINNNTYNAASNYVDPVGIQIVQLGSAEAADGEIIRGVFQRGINVRGARDAGYIFDPSSQGLAAPKLAGFLSKQTSGNAFAVIPAGASAPTFSVDAAAGYVRVGTSGTGLTPNTVQLHGVNSASVDFLASAVGTAGSQGYNMRLLNESNGALELWGINGSTNTKLGQWSTASANYFTVQGAASGRPVIYGCGGDANCSVEYKGAGTGGGLLGAFTPAADPTTSTLPAGMCADWENTATLSYARYCNFGGTLVKTALTAAGAPKLPQTTVTSLPGCNTSTDGLFFEVTDQSGTPSYCGALTGGGSLHWPAFCNGSSWTAH